MSQPSRFLVGIDLGTTNSACAFIDTESATPAAQVFPIPQLVAPGEIEARETLPSFHYEPAEARSLALPWDPESRHAVGVFARDHGAEVPARLIASAKSWLSHSAVDRTAELLPWHGAPDIRKLSPADASARFLAHIRHAWNHAHPAHPLEKQDVVVTIPASFDEVARELTVAASRKAGLPRIVLLEEPQAAFYAWMAGEGRDEQLDPGQTILVCDIGGGTSDFTLIRVQEGADGQLRFHRSAVGDHLILGGDNLDLALAHHLESQRGKPLDPRQWNVLVRRCQQAKEALLGAAPPEKFVLTVSSAGASLVGGSVKMELTRDDAVSVLLDGFLPLVPPDAKPIQRASGFQEFGLPYAPDHAITRYLAAFLAANDARPDAVLLNGGLFESHAMRERLLTALTSWLGGAPRVLRNERLDLAVALGAAQYALARRGTGARISSGLARAYYLGVQRGEENVAVCLAPAGLEEGEEVRLEHPFELLMRQPSEFPLYVSSLRTDDRAGDIIEIDPLQLTALPPIRTVFKSRDHGHAAVEIRARLTPIGTLEIWCGERDGSRRWKLQFDIRATTRTEATPHTGEGERAGFLDETTIAQSAQVIEAALAASSREAPEQLANELERTLDTPRLEWPPSLLRELWAALLPLEPAREKSPTHEARWLNLLGFTLRPGFGFALDDWRASQTWRLFEKKPAHHKSELCRSEWWILWRRVAGGLTAGQQRTLAEPLLATLRKGGPLWRGHEGVEIIRLLASLELLDPDHRVQLGDRLLEDVERRIAPWALGRLGNRVPFYGPLNTVIPPDSAERWASRLMDCDATEETLFALTQLTRRTGDRYRDVSEDTRRRVLAHLAAHNAPPHFTKLVTETGEFDEREREQAFGESLPAGLRLAG